MWRHAQVGASLVTRRAPRTKTRPAEADGIVARTEGNDATSRRSREGNL